MLALLSKLAEKKPILLFLNDLHFASLSTLKFLYTLSRLSIDSPLIIIATFNRMFRYADPMSNNHWEHFLRKINHSSEIYDCSIPYSPTLLFYSKKSFEIDYIQSISHE